MNRFVSCHPSSGFVRVGQGLVPCRDRRGTLRLRSGQASPRPTRSRAAVAFLLVSCLLLAACDSFERNAYRTLKVTKVEYELLQEHAARAYLAGRLTQEQWDHFAVAGNRFIAAHTLAADLMKTYQQARQARGSGSNAELAAIERQVAAALAELPRLLVDLRVLLETFEHPQPAPGSGKRR